MDVKDLEKLHAAVEWLLLQKSFSQAVQQLIAKLGEAHEPFVWTTIGLDTIPIALPASIKSCWVFHLKRDVPSGSHYHPNSVQHMIALNGRGRSNVGGVERTMVPIGSTCRSLAEKWHVIGKGVPHEFFPEGENMTVVSFHTCAESELEEIASGSGARRLYEPSGGDHRDAVAGNSPGSCTSSTTGSREESRGPKMVRAFGVGDCVRIPDGRIGRVREVAGATYRVRVRRATRATHQFLKFAAGDLKGVDCPKGWMSPTGYARYLRVTLAKMRQRQARSGKRRRA
jgi:hypothetical protein